MIAAGTRLRESPVNIGEPVLVAWPSPGQAQARVLSLQTKLHQWAAADPGRRFDDLYVRHEAPRDRVGVEGPRRWAVAAARQKLGTA